MPKDLKQLTALRFFAAMWVVLFHYWPSLGIDAPALVGKGYLGVDLFFTLSGFILCHVYLKGFGEGRFRYAEFLWARLARIYPLHIATLGGLAVLALGATVLGLHAGDKLLIWSSLVPNLLLLQAWGLAPDGGWNHPSWSISAEWFAYLAFPAFAFAAWRVRRRPVVAVLAASAFVVALQVGFERVAGFPLTKATLLWGALRIVPCFALGSAVNLLWRAKPLAAKTEATIVTLSALIAITAFAAVNTPDWASVIAFGALIYGMASLASAGSRALTSPALVYLGEVSFAVYMVCIPWELLVENGAHKVLHVQGDTLPLFAWLAMLAGALPAGMALHHLVERPARTAMRRHGAPFTQFPRHASPHNRQPVFQS
jgi:peptidoglycan/LPS O-acetylase OafA/YrhL